MDRYNFNTIEKKWQKFWDENQTYKTSIDKKKKNFMSQKCFLTRLEKYTWDM